MSTTTSAANITILAMEDSLLRNQQTAKSYKNINDWTTYWNITLVTFTQKHNRSHIYTNEAGVPFMRNQTQTHEHETRI